MAPSFHIAPNERTQITGDQDERCEFANDVAPHPPWHAHAHHDRRPCYCWSRGEFMPSGRGRPRERRWLLMHLQGAWLLYDLRELAAGRMGPVARYPGVLRSYAARLADGFIEAHEGS